MVFDFSEINKISGIGEYNIKKEKNRMLFYSGEKVFLVKNPNTIEVRTDAKLAQFLAEKYESVMQSRYFGKGGIEIVLAGQLSDDEIEDLIRLSYSLT
ncbi:MmcQ/YjbR family DNA-binding protein [Candidatus Saccharibacteria bacterium]|nr:MmcQ/YjbR family DNA-binding protein [Candidatus Saccharibacteria bacterium]